ncbi:T9SS type A sorting domain-containing protein [Cytophaga hutchinsonii]|nr:T9SS type A sorting domain-containing protein [Cytophaga hutchinsonii]
MGYNREVGFIAGLFLQITNYITMLAMHFKKAYTAAVCFISLLFFQTSAQNYPAVFDPTTLNGKNGFIVKGLNNEDRLGFEVNFIGDINKDGLEDVAISSDANKDGVNYGGTAYVIFGSQNPYPSPFDLTTLDGTNGFKVEGIVENEGRGDSVGKLGDINGDGIDDVAFSSSRNGAIILYGKRAGFPAVITKTYITGVNGFVFDHIFLGEIKNAGDVNGDGINDIIFGQGIGGSVFIVFGQTGNFPAVINTTWLDGIKGFSLASVDASRSGYYVGTAGDINGDGFGDVMVGIWTGSSPGQNLTYVYFGHAAPFTSLVQLKNVTGTDGFAIENKPGNFLITVGTLGDINGDGIDDCYSRSNIIFGSRNGFAQKFIPNGTNGFACAGFNQTSSGIGDVNGDGIDDFIVVAKNNENWVVYGSRQAFPVEFDPAVLDGTRGFKIKNLSQTNIGRQVSGKGDVNGDGLSDFMIGNEYGINSSNDKGEAYIVFGGDHYALPLTTDYPKALNITSAGFTLQVNTTEKGKITYAVYSGTAAAVTQQSVIAAGTGSIKYGEFSAATPSTNINKVLTGLTGGTAYDVYLYFQDEKGNAGVIYKLDNVTTLAADTQAPVITGCPANKKQGCGALLNYTSAVTVTDNMDATPTVTQSPVPGSPVKTNTTVTITARDKNNNTSTCVFLIEVVNSIQCPGNQQLAMGMALPDYAKDAAVTGFCEGIPTITQTPAPGTIAANNMKVTLTSTDGTITSTCSFVVNSTTTALEAQTDAAALIVYPNPATDVVYVNGSAYNAFEVIDNSGSIVLQGNADSEINLKNLSAGIYMILFYDSEQQIVAMKKVIKN